LEQQDVKDIYNTQKTLSYEDRKALQIMKASMTREDGKYVVRPPWKSLPENEPVMPNNYFAVERRFRSQEKKFAKDPNYYEEYKDALQTYIDSGVAEKVPANELNVPEGKVNFLPHHSVSHHRKSLRIVFDTKMKTNGKSISTEILSGPDLLNALIGVFFRFRIGDVAVMADIQRFYHSVFLPKLDWDMQRFLWYENMLGSPIVQFRLKAHIFGGISSQSCASLSLIDCIDKAAESRQITKEQAEKIKNSLYSDDSLSSFQTTEEAIDTMLKAIKVLDEFNFTLTKFLSNDFTFLQNIPEDRCAIGELDTEIKDVDTTALGMNWSCSGDYIFFDFKIPSDNVNTKRSLLSAIASLYDPAGLVSYAVIPAKLILQNAFRRELDWDDVLPDEMQREVDRALNALDQLKNLKIPRTYHIACKSPIRSRQLHLFSDGSEACYASMCFVRNLHEDGSITISLVATKTRLAPLRTKITIPRLELNGCVLPCRLSVQVQRELAIPFESITYWTDSCAVLGFIRNVKTRFNVYVGNRVSEIQCTTSICGGMYQQPRTSLME